MKIRSLPLYVLGLLMLALTACGGVGGSLASLSGGLSNPAVDSGEFDGSDADDNGLVDGTIDPTSADDVSGGGSAGGDVAGGSGGTDGSYDLSDDGGNEDDIYAYNDGISGGGSGGSGGGGSGGGSGSSGGSGGSSSSEDCGDDYYGDSSDPQNIPVTVARSVMPTGSDVETAERHATSNTSARSRRMRRPGMPGKDFIDVAGPGKGATQDFIKKPMFDEDIKKVGQPFQNTLDGEIAVATDQGVKSWDRPDQMQVFYEDAAILRAPVMSADGSHLFYLDDQARLQVVDVANGEKKVLAGDSGGPLAVGDSGGPLQVKRNFALMARGKALVLAEVGQDKTAFSVMTATGKVLHQYATAKGSGPASFAACPDKACFYHTEAQAAQTQVIKWTWQGSRFQSQVVARVPMKITNLKVTASAQVYFSGRPLMDAAKPWNVYVLEADKWSPLFSEDEEEPARCVVNPDDDNEVLFAKEIWTEDQVLIMHDLWADRTYEVARAAEISSNVIIQHMDDTVSAYFVGTDTTGGNFFQVDVTAYF